MIKPAHSRSWGWDREHTQCSSTPICTCTCTQAIYTYTSEPAFWAHCSAEFCTLDPTHSEVVHLAVPEEKNNWNVHKSRSVGVDIRSYVFMGEPRPQNLTSLPPISDASINLRVVNYHGGACPQTPPPLCMQRTSSATRYSPPKRQWAVPGSWLQCSSPAFWLSPRPADLAQTQHCALEQTRWGHPAEQNTHEPELESSAFVVFFFISSGCAFSTAMVHSAWIDGWPWKLIHTPHIVCPLVGHGQRDTSFYTHTHTHTMHHTCRCVDIYMIKVTQSD